LPQSIAQQARNRLGGHARQAKNPAQVEEAQRELAAARLEQHIKQVVDGMPPLTDDQLSRLAVLLRNRP